MSAERMKHLALAVLYDPTNALARGLMGMVSYGPVGASLRTSGGRPTMIRRSQAVIDDYLDAASSRPARPTRSSDWRPGARKTGSRRRPSRMTTSWFGSTLPGSPGGIWATRNQAASGSSPTTPPPRSRSPSVSDTPTDSGGPGWRGCATA